MADTHERDVAQDAEKYGELTVEVFAPAPYYTYNTKSDQYSYNIVLSKKNDLSGYFYERLRHVFVLIAGQEADLICVVPSSTEGCGDDP